MAISAKSEFCEIFGLKSGSDWMYDAFDRKLKRFKFLPESERMKNSGCTIKDVARYAGVSVGTASKVINHIYVRPEAKQRVEEAVEALGYVPNAMARGLKVSTTRTIGVMIPDISISVNNRMMRGIADACSKAGYSMMISDFSMSEAKVLQVLQMFQEKKVDGIIYASNPISAELAEAFRNSGIPVILIMTEGEDKAFPKLTIDNEAAAHCIVKHLIDLGHREILLLSGPHEDTNSGLPRELGYRRALEEAGIPIVEDRIHCGDFTFLRGYEETRRLLEEGAEFSAIFCGADLIAMGAIRAIIEKGLRVPEDISIAGYDGIDASRYITPPLCTIQQPFIEYGTRSVELLIRMIEEEAAVENELLDWKLVPGGTAAKKVQ